ncbi:MAG: hypothetical protein ABR577_19295, partial [Pyrinomonadaceae bacterium]
FLEEHNAHDKVQMIAGTSIGSWNALFWLAGLVKGANGAPGALEKWWSSVDVQGLVLPVTYVPTRRNYFLSNKPWQETFDMIFREPAVGGENAQAQEKPSEAGKQLLYHVRNPSATDAMRFYFTRSNIEKANLSFTTNRHDWIA